MNNVEYSKEMDKIEGEAVKAIGKTFTQWSMQNAKKRGLVPDDVLAAVSRALFRCGFDALVAVKAVTEEDRNRVERTLYEELGNLIETEMEKLR